VQKLKWKKIRTFERGFMATHLINIGSKLGVFEKLNEKKEEGLNVADLATELGVHEPYLKFWCQTAYHFELLDCDDQGKFKLQPFLDEILDKGIKFLDIGCGNGSLIIQFANAFENSKFVGINPDVHGVDAAKATISQLGLEERVTVEHIGGEKISYKDEFDMVSMVVTLHEILPDIR